MNWRGGQAPGHSEISSWSQGFSLGLNYHDTCDWTFLRGICSTFLTPLEE